MSRLLQLPAAIMLALPLLACEPPDNTELPIANAVRNNDTQAVVNYLAEGGDPNAVSRDGQPLLYLATGPRGGLEVMVVLINGGADLEATLENGRTALMNAAGWCDADMVTLLLRAGADPRRAAADNKTARDAVCAGPLDLRAEVLNILDAAL